MVNSNTVNSKSQLFKTFCGLKIGWILRKLWPKICVYALFPSSTYIVLQPLGVFDLSLTSLMYFNIHSIWWYGLSLSFSKLFAGWKLVEYLWHIQHCFDLCMYTIKCIQCYVCYVSQHLQHQTMCIDTYWHAPFNVYTTDKVTMITVSGFLTI